MTTIIAPSAGHSARRCQISDLLKTDGTASGADTRSCSNPQARMHGEPWRRRLDDSHYLFAITRHTLSHNILLPQTSS
jgi:hypothetical protein